MLLHRHTSDINRLLVTNVQKELHEIALTEAINGYRFNRVQNKHPPAITEPVGSVSLTVTVNELFLAFQIVAYKDLI